MIYLVEDLKKKTYKEFLKSLIIKKIINSAIPSVTPNLFADGFAEIECREYRVNEVLMNTKTYAEIRKMKYNFVDHETERKNLLKGMMAYLWGACIIVSQRIPDDTILILSEPEYNMATILKIKESKKYDYVKKLMEQSANLKKLAHNIISETEEINKMIYEITKTEEQYGETKRRD